ncbi:acylphosphatase [bacterium]|nr:acylphosphatase [bacterium]
MPRKHVIVHGYVQGVGFRFFTTRQAEYAGVTGWVRNRRDGTVELEAQGDPASLESFLESVRKGPGGGEVSDMDIETIPESDQDQGFEVRF